MEDRDVAGSGAGGGGGAEGAGEEGVAVAVGVSVGAIFGVQLNIHVSNKKRAESLFMKRLFLKYQSVKNTHFRRGKENC